VYGPVVESAGITLSTAQNAHRLGQYHLTIRDNQKKSNPVYRLGSYTPPPLVFAVHHRA
jgi:hypothetical protein